MKAIVLEQYGSPQNLHLQEVEKPSPKQHEVIIKVRAAAINDYDWAMCTGQYRLLFGLTKPKHSIPGMELAGKVESVGSAVSSFKIGDEVYGDTSEFGFGAFAEYACVHEKSLVAKPKQMSYEEAASISHASILALQGLCDIGNIQPRQKILINGAGGGVGTFGLQIAKLYDAEVTGVDTGDKLDMMTQIGYDHVIDYRKVDFTQNGKQYDLILDTKTNRSPIDYVSSLKPNGKYVTVGGRLRKLLQVFLTQPILKLFYQKSFKVVALKPNVGLDRINELYEKNKLKCVIDGPYSIKDVPKLVQRFGEGKHTGKIIISLPDE